MRALVISPPPPPPAGADFGGDKRLRLFVEGLARVFDEIDFLHLVPSPLTGAPELTAGAGAEAVWGVRGSIASAPLARRRGSLFDHYVRGMVSAGRIQSLFPFTGQDCVAAVRDALAARPDLVFVHELSAMLPAPAARPTAPVLFDLADLMHRTHAREATTAPIRAGCIGYLAQTPVVIAAERRAVTRATRSTVCAEADRRFIARLGAGTRASTVQNAVAAPARTSPPPAGATVAFLGNYGYRPNVLAVERLVSRIWPLIRRARPDYEAGAVRAGIADLARSTVCA